MGCQDFPIRCRSCGDVDAGFVRLAVEGAATVLVVIAVPLKRQRSEIPRYRTLDAQLSTTGVYQ